MRHPFGMVAMVWAVFGLAATAGADAPSNAETPKAATVAADTMSVGDSTAKAIVTVATDLSGEWMLDSNRSDAPPMRDGERGGNGNGRWGGGEGRWGGGRPDGERPGGGAGRRGRPREGGEPGGASGPEGARPVRLPAHVHVTQTSTVVSFEDSTGAVLQEIATVPAEADTFARAPGAMHRRGAWNAHALETSHAGPRGVTITETWSLGTSPDWLTCAVHVKGGDMPERTFRRVYHRVSEK